MCFGALRLLNRALAIVGVASVPGVYLARWLLEHTAGQRHTLFVEILILGGGVFVLRRGMVD